MRVTLGVGAGALMMWLLLTRGPARLAWVLTRIPVPTPADHVDRYRSWHHGIEGERAWPTPTPAEGGRG